MQSWQQLASLVKLNGCLGIMTLRHDTAGSFNDWWYKNDITHISFYSLQTWQWLAEKYSLKLVHYTDRVAIFQNRLLD